MKIAIASIDKNEKGNISENGARAPYFLIFENKKLIEILKNPFAIGGGGAGWSVAHILSEKSVDKFISGKIGENMKTALGKKNIKFEELSGKIENFLKR
jgi:predicted Fe-Mo cluster-binding NifX family protein